MAVLEQIKAMEAEAGWGDRHGKRLAAVQRAVPRRQPGRHRRGHGAGQGGREGAEPRIEGARRELDEGRDDFLLNGDWFGGEATGIRNAEAALSQAVLGRADRSRAVRDPTELLIVDEVDRVKMSGLEQLRSIFDASGIWLVLVGMPGLERRLARYAQLYSRIGFVHEFRPLGPSEVRDLLGRWRPPRVSLPDDLLAEAEAVAAIIRVTGGNFRLLDRLLTQVARIVALNGLKGATREAVEAAREVLLIGAA
jgi:hypothetical protein